MYAWLLGVIDERTDLEWVSFFHRCLRYCLLQAIKGNRSPPIKLKSVICEYFKKRSYGSIQSQIVAVAGIQYVNGLPILDWNCDCDVGIVLTITDNQTSAANLEPKQCNHLTTYPAFSSSSLLPYVLDLSKFQPILWGQSDYSAVLIQTIWIGYLNAFQPGMVNHQIQRIMLQDAYTNLRLVQAPNRWQKIILDTAHRVTLRFLGSACQHVTKPD